MHHTKYCNPKQNDLYLETLQLLILKQCHLYNGKTAAVAYFKAKMFLTFCAKKKSLGLSLRVNFVNSRLHFLVACQVVVADGLEILVQLVNQRNT